MDEPAPKPTALDRLKAFSPATGVALACLLAFLVCCQIDAYAVRWWLMLPLAAIGGARFGHRRRRAAGAEAKICTAGLVLLLALVVLRDIGLSRKLAELFDKMQHYKSQVDEATSEFRRFFEGGR